MAGNEPGGRAARSSSNRLEQPRAADFAGEQAARDIARGVLAAVGAEPAGNGVDVDAEGAEYFLLAASTRSRQRPRAPCRLHACRRHQRARLIAKSAPDTCPLWSHSRRDWRRTADLDDFRRTCWCSAALVKHSTGDNGKPLGGNRTDRCSGTVPSCELIGKGWCGRRAGKRRASAARRRIDKQPKATPSLLTSPDGGPP